MSVHLSVLRALETEAVCSAAFLPRLAGLPLTSERTRFEQTTARAAAALLHRLLTALIVNLTLALVAQHIERLLHILPRLLIATLVRVVLHRELAVRLLDLVGRRVLLDAEDLLDIKHARTRKKR